MLAPLSISMDKGKYVNVDTEQECLNNIFGPTEPKQEFNNMSLSNRSMKSVQGESKFSKGGLEILAADLDENHLSN